MNEQIQFFPLSLQHTLPRCTEVVTILTSGNDQEPYCTYSSRSQGNNPAYQWISSVCNIDLFTYSLHNSWGYIDKRSPTHRSVFQDAARLGWIQSPYSRSTREACIRWAQLDSIYVPADDLGRENGMRKTASVSSTYQSRYISTVIRSGRIFKLWKRSCWVIHSIEVSVETKPQWMCSMHPLRISLHPWTISCHRLEPSTCTGYHPSQWLRSADACLLHLRQRF